MDPARSKPEGFDELERAIVARFPSLSKRLQQIASYALDSPNELALETIAVMARRAGVQPSSLIRFAKVFGFSGYSDMQRVFRLRLTDAMPDYKERLRSLRREPSSEQPKDLAALLHHFAHADILALERLQAQPRTVAALERALELIAASETVYLVGHRRSFPVCCYLSYALSQMSVKNVLVDGVGGMFFQQLSHATASDVVFAVSSKAYSPDVIEVVRDASKRGVPVIALTDSRESPLAEHAEVTLELENSPVHLFRSLAAPMTLALTLVVGLGRVLEQKRNGHARRKQNYLSGLGSRRSRTKPISS